MRSLIWTAVLVGGSMLAIGFGIGRFSAPTVPGDPGRTVETSSNSSGGPQRNLQSGGSSIFSELSQDEIRERAARVVSETSARENSPLLKVLIEEWVQKDPYGALEFVQENGRKDLLYDCLTTIGESDLDGALGWIGDNVTDLSFQTFLMGAVYRGQARNDPEAAIALIEKNEGAARRDRFLYAAIDEWAGRDVQGAFDWIEAQEISPFLSAAYAQVLGRFIEQSPKEAAFLISEMEENTEKANFSNRVAYELAKKDPKQALEWAEGLMGEAKQFALMGLMESWGGTPDGFEALDYVKSLPVSQNNEELFSMAVMKVAQANPEALARELASLNERQQRVAAVQLAQVYGSNDPVKAMEWLATLDNEKVRDAALQTSLATFRRGNIDQAFQLSETFADATIRREEMQQTLLEWMPVDPEAALQALENSTVLQTSEKLSIENFLSRNAPGQREFLLPARQGAN